MLLKNMDNHHLVNKQTKNKKITVVIVIIQIFN